MKVLSPVYHQSGQPTVDVLAYGAAGDGSTDDTAAFQAAIDRANALGGGIVFVPPTDDGYRLTGQLDLKPFVVLKGVWNGPPSGTYRLGAGNKGSELQVTFGSGGTDPADAFITMNRGSQIDGLTFYYPNQTPTDPPIAYPPTVAGAATAGDTTVSNCLFVNPYIALWFDNHERCLFRHVYGEPLNIGIYLDRIVDVPRLESVHFWAAFWQEYDLNPVGPGYALSSYLQANATAFKFGRVDDVMMSQCGVAGYYRGIWFAESAVGPVYGSGGGYTYGKLSNCMFDLCTIGMQYDGGTFPIAIANTTIFCSGTADQADLRAVVTTGGAVNHGGLTFTNCTFGGLDLPPVLIDILNGTGDQTITLIGCYFDTWQNAAGGGAAVRLADGVTQLALIGCEWRQSGATYVHLDVNALDGSDTNQKTLIGCKFKTQQTIDNAGGTPIIEVGSAIGANDYGQFGKTLVSDASNASLIVKALGAFSAGIRMIDAGGVDIFLRQSAGVFQIVDDGFTTALFQVSQAGDAALVGGFTAAFLKLTTGASAGKVLTSDAVGVGTWETPASGPPSFAAVERWVSD